MLERGFCGGTAFFCAGAEPPDTYQASDQASVEIFARGLASGQKNAVLRRGTLASLKARLI
jgi:hypothetical protein